ncbi:MAG: tetratricopeptide repeat protein, partial [Gammaproteobacteria bacterium]
EILLLAQQPKEAREQFEIALLRHEDRAHALIGAARAHARSGNVQDAVAAYAEFVDQWQGDPKVLREARDYLAHAR